MQKVCFFNSIHSVSCLINQGLQGLTNNGNTITLSEESDIVVGRDLKEQYGSLEDLDISTDGVDIPLFLNSLGTLAFIRSFTVISKLLLTVSLILVLLC